MKDKLRTLLPPIALIAAIALAGTAMLGVSSQSTFEVDFDDCGIFEGIELEGSYTLGRDLAIGRFCIEAGKTLSLSPIDRSSADFGWTQPFRGYSVGGEELPEGMRELSLYTKLSIPEGTKFSDSGLAKNPDGTVRLSRDANGFDSVTFKLDSIGYRYELKDGIITDKGGVLIPLGEDKISHGEFRVRVEPKNIITDEDGAMSFVFSDDPDDYDVIGLFSERLEALDAYIEKTERGYNCYHFDRYSNEVVLTELEGLEPISTRVIGKFDLGDSYLQCFRGKDGRAIIATAEEGVMTVAMLADGEVYTKDVTFGDSASVEGVLTGGAAIFYIVRHPLSGESETLIEGFDSNGENFVSLELEPIELPDGISYNRSRDGSFDALYRDGKLYILENASYTALVSSALVDAPSPERINEIERHGVGLVGKLVRMSLIEGGTVCSAYPLSAETASEYGVFVKFQFSEE